MADFVARWSRSRSSLLIIIAAGLVVLGLWMTGLFGPPPTSRRSSESFSVFMGCCCIALGSVAGVALARRLFDVGEQLRIGTSGIRWRPWSEQTIPWSEVKSVTTWHVSGQKGIALHLRDRALFPGKGLLAALAGANRMLAGGDISISMTGTDRSFAEALAAIESFRADGS